MVEKHQAVEIAASDRQATADNMPPRTLQVQVSMGKANDAAVHSPLGNMATGDYPAHAETAPKLQAAPDEVEKHQADEIAASDLKATADNMPPRTLKVQVSKGKANDAAVHSPLGNIATGNYPAPKFQAAAEEFEKHLADETPASGPRATADTMQPRRLQAQVCTV